MRKTTRADPSWNPIDALSNTPKYRLIECIERHQKAEQNQQGGKGTMTTEERLKRLESRDEEAFSLMVAVLSDSIAVALNQTERDARDEWQKNELPPIEDRLSFIAHVSMISRHAHERRITGAEARALLYAAQLSYAALKGGEPNAIQAQSTLP
jgi:hypothetical protein